MKTSESSLAFCRSFNRSSKTGACECLSTSVGLWCADDSAAFGSLEHVRSWWDRLTTEGPSYGYFANPPKTWLVTKDSYLQNAVKIFAGSGVNITPNGRPYLGAALGSPDFIEEHLRSKVEEWTSNITFLSEIAKSQPHAAYSALVHGLSSRWSYLSRVTPNISHLFDSTRYRLENTAATHHHW